MQGPLVIPAKEQKSQNVLPAKKRKSIYDTVTDTEMVEKVFGFLPSMIGGQEGQAPTGFEVKQPQREMGERAQPLISINPLASLEKLPGWVAKEVLQPQVIVQKRGTSVHVCGQPFGARQLSPLEP